MRQFDVRTATQALLCAVIFGCALNAPVAEGATVTVRVEGVERDRAGPPEIAQAELEIRDVPLTLEMTPTD